MKVLRKSLNVADKKAVVSFNSRNLNIEKSIVWALNLNDQSNEMWRQKEIHVACQKSPGLK